MGDGEQSEGSIWEAVANAVHYRLGNLVAIVDYNGLEADGTIDELTALGDIGAKYKAFGFNVISINGNSVAEIKECFDNLPQASSEIPTCIIAHTVKGKGVNFMENQVRWHAGKITNDQLNHAVDELITNYERKWINE